MPRQPARDITDLRRDWRRGDAASADELMPRLEVELSRIARTRPRSLRDRLRLDGLDASLETAGLINEAYLRLVDQRQGWQGRAHFFGVAATKMRHICVDYARKVRAARRGGGVALRPLEEAGAIAAEGSVDSVDLLALHQALEKLEELDSRQGKIVELRYFAGLGDREIAEVLGVSEATVRRGWRSARAWLYRTLGGDGP